MGRKSDILKKKKQTELLKRKELLQSRRTQAGGKPSKDETRCRDPSRRKPQKIGVERNEKQQGDARKTKRTTHGAQEKKNSGKTGTSTKNRQRKHGLYMKR